MSTGAAYARCDGGLRLRLRVTPNAPGDRIDGRHETADGTVSLHLRVTAQPEKGRANKAVIAVLAKAIGQAKSTIEVTAGLKDRNKTVAISGEFTELARRIENLLGA